MAEAAQVEHGDGAPAAGAAGGTAGTGTAGTGTAAAPAAVGGAAGGGSAEPPVGWPPELGGMLAVVDSGSAAPAVTRCGAVEMIHTI